MKLRRSESIHSVEKENFNTRRPSVNHRLCRSASSLRKNVIPRYRSTWWNEQFEGEAAIPSSVVWFPNLAPVSRREIIGSGSAGTMLIFNSAGIKALVIIRSNRTRDFILILVILDEQQCISAPFSALLFRPDGHSRSITALLISSSSNNPSVGTYWICRCQIIIGGHDIISAKR